MAFLSGVHFLTGLHCKLRPNAEGTYSLEVITTLFCLKLQFPNRVFLVRGNHEDLEARCSPLYSNQLPLATSLLLVQDRQPCGFGGAVLWFEALCSTRGCYWDSRHCWS
jgi:hypothetical protein